MTDSDSTQPNSAPETQPVKGQPAPGEISSLARIRAAQAKQESAPAPVVASNAGEPTPTSGQATVNNQRSEYIPRERFDQVNTRLQQAEAYIQQMQSQGGMRPVQQQAAPQLSMGGQVLPQTTQAQQNAQVAQSQPVQNLLAQVADKGEQDRWRRKITENPVTGLAEFISHAIQVEGGPLLQQAISQVQQQFTQMLAPIQQTFIQQRLQTYTSQRESDPTWNQVAPAFNALAMQAAARGYNVSDPATLSVIEAVARQQVGLPVFQAPQPPAQAPFTERPGSSGQGFGQAQTPQLTPLELQMAARFNMTPAEYAQSKANLRRG